MDYFNSTEKIFAGMVKWIRGAIQLLFLKLKPAYHLKIKANIIEIYSYTPYEIRPWINKLKKTLSMLIWFQNIWLTRDKLRMKYSYLLNAARTVYRKYPVTRYVLHTVVHLSALCVPVMLSILQNVLIKSFPCLVCEPNNLWMRSSIYDIAKWGNCVTRNGPSHIVHHRVSAVKHHMMQRISYLANDTF